MICKFGDMINEDDAHVDVETDKAAVTIPSPANGKVVNLGGAVDNTVMVAEVIALIEETKSCLRSVPSQKTFPSGSRDQALQTTVSRNFARIKSCR